MEQQLLIQGQTLYESVARELTDKVVSALGDEVDAVILYGSVARGEATPDSDIDILVIGKHIHDYEEKILDISYDLDLDFGTLTTVIYRTPQEIEKYISMGSTFLPKVLRHGEFLYGREQSYASS